VTAWSEQLAPARGVLVDAGLDLHGVLSAERYDARVAPVFRSRRRLPEAQSAWVIGSAGSRLFTCFRASAFAALRRPDPLDAYVAEQVATATALVASAGIACASVLGHVADAGAFPDLVAVAHEAGLGWPSRLGLLLHPDFGPWTSLRAVLLTEAELDAGYPLPGVGPCGPCPGPCMAACPVAAPTQAGFQLERCAGVRLAGGCADHCAARRACPVGCGARYTAEAEAYHMAAAEEGLRAWR